MRATLVLALLLAAACGKEAPTAPRPCPRIPANLVRTDTVYVAGTRTVAAYVDVYACGFRVK